MPTVREPDGLALSSRNRYLDPDAARAAAARSRRRCAPAQRAPRRHGADAALAAARAVLRRRAGVDLDYLELTDPDLGPRAAPPAPARLLVAARVGSTRLIDNVRTSHLGRRRLLMLRTMLKSKIHRATVTQADLHYVGSVTVDEDLLDAADLLPGEQVHIVDVTNGARLETYVIAGERGSGVIGINGAAAHLVHPGDLVILISYGAMDETEAKSYHPARRPRRRRATASSSSAPTRPRRPRACWASGAATSSTAEPCCSRSTSATARPSSPPSTGSSGSAAGGSRPRRGRTADELRVASGAACSGDAEITGVAACSTVPACCASCGSCWTPLEVPVVADRARRAHRRPAARRQPARGRRRPGREHPGGARVRHRLYGSGRRRRRRLRHVHQRRRRRPERASSSAARSPPASRSRWTRSPPARPQLRTVELVPALGDRQEHRGVPAVGRGATASPGRSTGWCGGSLAELVAQFGAARSSWPPVGWPRSWSTSCRTITEHEPDLTVLGLRLAFERHQAGRRRAPGRRVGRPVRLGLQREPTGPRR